MIAVSIVYKPSNERPWSITTPNGQKAEFQDWWTARGYCKNNGFALPSIHEIATEIRRVNGER